MSLFLKMVQKKIGNKNSSVVSDGIVGDLSGFIDTGSFLLNAAISGSMFKGFPDNKVSMLAGPPGVGKSFILLTMISRFLKTYPKANVVFFETESAQRKDTMENFGIDTSRVLFCPILTAQELRFQTIQILEEYEKIPEKEREELKLFICLDSLGNLSTVKEVSDSTEGKETQDMTRAKLIKSIFRVISLKLGILNVPFIVTNHIYMSQNGLYPQAVVGGGCLSKGTQILMADGTLRCIEEIQEGDLVQTEYGASKVSTVWNPSTLIEPNPDCIRLTFFDDSTIVCSKKHKFRFKGDWIKAKDLKEGIYLDTKDTLYNENAQIIKIESIGRNEVYDIEVKDGHHYILSNGVLSHNSGGQYISSTICLLSKRKEKEGTEFVGNIVHCKMEKSRFTREGSTVDIFINFSSGLSLYHGILDEMVSADLVKSVGNRFIFPSSDKKVFKKEINRNPELFFTNDLMEKLDKIISTKFLYGAVLANSEDENDEDENTDYWEETET